VFVFVFVFVLFCFVLFCFVLFCFVLFCFVANAPESDKRNLLSELELMKKLKPHPHVIKLMGYVTETGKENTDDITEITFTAMIRLSALPLTSAPSLISVPH